MDLLVDTSRATPPSRQLIEGVLDQIAAGTWGAGDRLPSVRQLASDALVNPNTVGKAYRELEVLGVVEGRAGAGVFVTAKGPAKARAQRRGATLETLRGALHAVIRAGHDPEVVRKEIERQLGKAKIEGAV